MPAYVVVTRLRTRNPAELELYRDQIRDLPSASEFKWLARFEACDVKEGPNVEGVAILEFPTLDQAQAWYANPDYQKAAQHRFMGGDYSFIIVEGASAG
ncbi:MAG: DUF1330 domain-containing protein [Rhizomicrobium sp.]